MFLYLVTCARLSWPHSAFQSTLNTRTNQKQKRDRKVFVKCVLIQWRRLRSQPGARPGCW